MDETFNELIGYRLKPDEREVLEDDVVEEETLSTENME